MKTKEELNALKEEVEEVSKKLNELTDEELAQVTGGVFTRGYNSRLTNSSTMVAKLSSRRPN